MKFLRKSVETAKSMPKAVWVAAAILPGGLMAIGLYIVGKGLYENLKKKNQWPPGDSKSS